MYYIHVILSFFGIALTGCGKHRIDRAMMTFIKAKQELEIVKKLEEDSLKKNEKKVEKLRKELEKRELKIEKNSIDRKYNLTTALKRLDKIDKFLE